MSQQSKTTTGTMQRLRASDWLFAIVMLAFSTVTSWTQLVSSDDPAWRTALFHIVPSGLGDLVLRPGM